MLPLLTLVKCAIYIKYLTVPLLVFIWGLNYLKIRYFLLTNT